MSTQSRPERYSTHTFTENPGEWKAACCLPPTVLAEGCGWERCFGSETSHANLPLASIGQARKLILLTQFRGAPWEPPPTPHPRRHTKSKQQQCTTVPFSLADPSTDRYWKVALSRVSPFWVNAKCWWFFWHSYWIWCLYRAIAWLATKMPKGRLHSISPTAFLFMILAKIHSHESLQRGLQSELRRKKLSFAKSFQVMTVLTCHLSLECHLERDENSSCSINNDLLLHERKALKGWGWLRWVSLLSHQS